MACSSMIVFFLHEVASNLFSFYYILVFFEWYIVALGTWTFKTNLATRGGKLNISYDGCFFLLVFPFFPFFIRLFSFEEEYAFLPDAWLNALIRLNNKKAFVMCLSKKKKKESFCYVQVILSFYYLRFLMFLNIGELVDFSWRILKDK